jgi:hypothetical protein
MNLPESLEKLITGAKHLKFSVVSGHVIDTVFSLSETIKIQLQPEEGIIENFEFPDTAPVRKNDFVSIVRVSINGSIAYPICVINKTSGQERAVDFNHVQQVALVSKTRVYLLSLLTAIGFFYLIFGAIAVYMFWNELSIDFVRKNVGGIVAGILCVTFAPMISVRFWRGIQDRYEARLAGTQSAVRLRRDEISAWVNGHK